MRAEEKRDPITKGFDLDEMIEALVRIERRVTEFDYFYRAGLDKLESLDRTFQQLDATMNRIENTVHNSVMQFAKHASGIVPGGLIPVRAAFLMVIVSLGIANADEIVRYIMLIVHLLTAV